jgi:predicted TIM-barrel fold metal-dependent hydrolase
MSNPSHDVLDYALRYFGADKLMFGSDYPYVESKVLLNLIDGLSLSQADKDACLWKNAARVFGL